MDHANVVENMVKTLTSIHNHATRQVNRLGTIDPADKAQNDQYERWALVQHASKSCQNILQALGSTLPIGSETFPVTPNDLAYVLANLANELKKMGQEVTALQVTAMITAAYFL